MPPSARRRWASMLVAAAVAGVLTGAPVGGPVGASGGLAPAPATTPVPPAGADGPAAAGAEDPWAVALREVTLRWQAGTLERTVAITERRDAEARLAAALAEREGLAAEGERLATGAEAAAALAAEAAAEAYVGADHRNLALVGLLGSSDVFALSLGPVVLDARAQAWHDAHERATAAEASLDAHRRDHETTVADAAAAVVAARDRVRRASEALVAVAAERSAILPALEEAVEGLPVRLDSVTAIPLVALDAYRRAEAQARTLWPGCGIRWWLLAAVGKVESNHGRLGGSVPRPGGLVWPPALGPVLDGTGVGGNWTPIFDTDGGVLDGDTVYDRAVGPMQFIPSTWRMVGMDGDGDGIADPNNYYDAALANARYLCRYGDLRTEPALRAAIFGYNRLLSYVDKVLTWAGRYAAVDGEVPAALPRPSPPEGSAATGHPESQPLATEPLDPEAVEADLVDLVDPEPVEVEPVEPAPAGPVEPAPVGPTPVEPVELEPVEPIEPEAVDPRPGELDGSERAPRTNPGGSGVGGP